jgi:hypothetical protein
MDSSPGVTKGHYYVRYQTISSPLILGLNNGVTYYFVVTAVNIHGEGQASQEVSATPSFGSYTTISRIEITPSTASIPIGGAKQFQAVAYDLNNYQMCCLTFTWNSSETTVATINSNGMATGVSSGTTTISASANGVTSNSAALTVTTDEIRKITLKTNDLIFDPSRQRIYASVPSSAGVDFGNTVTVIDPQTGAIGPSVFVGSEPNRLAISDDGQFLYVALDGAAAIRRVNLLTFEADLQFPLGSDTFGGLYLAKDIEVLPGNSHAIAVTRIFKNTSGSGGVAIYSDGTQLTNTVSGYPNASDAIEFSATSSRLYGYSSYSNFQRLNVDSAGVSFFDNTPSLITGYNVDIKFDDGLIYTSSGQVIDPEEKILMGTFSDIVGSSYAPLVRPDSSSGRTFYLTSVGYYPPNLTWILQSFDIDTFVPVGSVEIPGVSGQAGSLIRWGDHGLAFRAADSQVFLVRTALVP